MELLAPAGLAALVALPAIAALYFLRRRNPPRVIGSLLLWTDARAQVLRGRPWERFRPTTSLWLQLLAAAALAVALAYPACVHTGSQSGQLVIVLDASASMGATDGSPRRWDDAIDAALAAIDGAPDGAQSAILLAGVNARLVEPLTKDRNALRGHLERLRRQGPDDGLSPGLPNCHCKEVACPEIRPVATREPGCVLRSARSLPIPMRTTSPPPTTLPPNVVCVPSLRPCNRSTATLLHRCSYESPRRRPSRCHCRLSAQVPVAAGLRVGIRR